MYCYCLVVFTNEHQVEIEPESYFLNQDRKTSLKKVLFT